MIRNWSVIAACAVAMMFSATGIWGSTLGVFLAPLQGAFGWSQTQVYLGVTIAYLSAQIAAPWVGWMVDRGHVRRLILGALCVQALAFAGFSHMDSRLAVFYSLCVITAVAILGVSAIPMVRIVNGWFTTRRGLALGILFAASTVGPVIHPVIANQLIETLGWRRTYAVFASMILALGFGAAALAIRERREVPRLVNPDPAASGPIRADALSTALSQRDFWVIAIWLVLYAYSYNGLTLHLVPLLGESGLERGNAAFAQSLLGVGTMAGNLLAGALLDRVHASRLATLVAILPMVGIALLSYVPSITTAYLMATSTGLAAGSEASILIYMLGRYFPAAVLGRVVSIQIIALATGAAIGPTVAALLHDHFGNYQVMLAVTAFTFAVAACTPLSLGRYRF